MIRFRYLNATNGSVSSVDVKASFSDFRRMARSPKSLRKNFAANMRRKRRELDLSQEDLAERAGLHRTYLSSVERGERNVSIDNIEKIALALGVSATLLLGEKPSS